MSGRIDRTAAMSDEELAGQLLMLGFTGREPAAAEEAKALKPAGFSLLPRNLIDAAQTAAQARGLQEAAVRAGLAPLFIAADQEGGAVTAVAEGATVFPGAMALGAAGSPALTRRMARAQGREAAAMGINLNYAPVADVNTDPENPIIGVRSFGDDPAAVGRHVAAAVRGYQESGVLAAAKHFPGHGATRVDSHLGLSILDTAPAVLERRELAPFRAAVGAGAGAVMT
ncbi:MAG: glycoside hydrolase family 3 N-terminal domain-containing protein, partial [Bacteroidota bacterium]